MRSPTASRPPSRRRLPRKWQLSTWSQRRPASLRDDPARGALSLAAGHGRIDAISGASCARCTVVANTRTYTNSRAILASAREHRTGAHTRVCAPHSIRAPGIRAHGIRAHGIRAHELRGAGVERGQDMAAEAKYRSDNVGDWGVPKAAPGGLYGTGSLAVA